MSEPPMPPALPLGLVRIVEPEGRAAQPFAEWLSKLQVYLGHLTAPVGERSTQTLADWLRGSGVGGGLTVEDVDDRVAALLQAGANITLSYNDAANTLTIAAAGGGGGGLSFEDVDDRVAALLQPGPNITLNYDDVANTLEIASTGGGGATSYATEPLINGKLVAAIAGGDLTVALKTWAGADPSVLDPVMITFRRPDGTSVLRTITAPMSLVETGAQSAVANTPFRLWVSMLDDAGALSLFLTNASPPNAIVTVFDHIHPLIVSRVLGYMDWNIGLAVPGTWDRLPNVIQAYGPGVKLPGDILQSRSATCTSRLTVTGTSPQNIPGMSVLLTPTSPVNRFACSLWGSIGNETGDGSSMCAVSIRRGGALISGSEALVGHVSFGPLTTGGVATIFGTDAPGTISPVTWTGRIRATAAGNDVFMEPGGVLSITEVMG